MKTKNLVTAAVLLSIGTVLHLIVPPFPGGMKPDFILVTMFFAILMNLKLGSTLTIGIVAGLLGAATTTFPGGQIPNVIDKVCTAIFVLLLFKGFTLKSDISSIKTVIITIIGTMFSGLMFLTSASILSGLPGSVSILSMIMIVVVPAAVFNAILAIMIYKTMKIYKKTIA